MPLCANKFEGTSDRDGLSPKHEPAKPALVEHLGERAERFTERRHERPDRALL